MNKPTDTPRVHDNPSRSRFEITVGEHVAGFAAYRRRNERVVLTHTEIEEAYQGQRLAGELARHALQTIRSEGLHVTPLCPYIADYIRHQRSVSDGLLCGSP